MATQRTQINRNKRHKLLAALASGLAATALAVPGVAAGRTDTGTAATSANPGTTLHRDASRAVPFVSNVSPTATAVDASSGFDWGDAMIGAGGAVAMVAVIGAGGLTIRSRRRVEPAATAQS